MIRKFVTLLALGGFAFSLLSMDPKVITNEIVQLQTTDGVFELERQYIDLCKTLKEDLFLGGDGSMSVRTVLDSATWQLIHDQLPTIKKLADLQKEAKVCEREFCVINYRGKHCDPQIKKDQCECIRKKYEARMVTSSDWIELWMEKKAALKYSKLILAPYLTSC